MVAERARPEIRFYFDYVDPLSFLLERELAKVRPEPITQLERVGVEIRMPPAPPTDPEDPFWIDRWRRAAAAAAALGVEMATPSLVPWSRKAHELLLHARDQGRAGEVHAALMKAFFEEAADIGRVDVLVELAGRSGLDASETKAVLDVDRYAGEVRAVRDQAMERGIRAVPALEVGGRRLEGFHNREDIRTFLLPAP